MPRRKAENGSTAAGGGGTKPRSRRTKKDTTAAMEQKLDIMPMYDAQAPSSVQAVQMMHNHNGMMSMHDDGGPMSSHNLYTSPAGSMAGSMVGSMPGPPPPDYYQQMPPGYQSGMMPPHGGPAPPQQQAQHTFIEPEPPQSPYINQPPHMQQHNHMMMRYRPVPAMGPSNHHQGPPQSQLEFRLHEMNRRLYIFSNSGIQDKDHAQWWDAFAHEFFDDEARMTITIYDEQNPAARPNRYGIGRQLIPRYFRSIFDSGVKEMYYVLRSGIREQMNGYVAFFECENVLIVTKHDKPFPSEVQTECKLVCEFAFDETYGHRVRHWNLDMRQCQEYVLRDPNMLQDSETQEKMKKSITTTGMTPVTLNYLKLCVVLEPMQVLMSQSKTHGITPKESLKQTIFHAHSAKCQMQQQQQQQQHQQQMVMNAMSAMNPPHQMPPAPVEEPIAKKQRKRTRKTAGAGGAQTAGAKKKNTASPAPNAANFQSSSHYPVPYQDVMVVGEPSMMGGDYGEEDERTISRVENTQYDPNAMQNQMGGMNPSMNPSITPLGGPPSQTYMSGYEMSSMNDWGVGGAGQVPPSGGPPATCGANLGVAAPIAACDSQQS